MAIAALTKVKSTPPVPLLNGQFQPQTPCHLGCWCNTLLPGYTTGPMSSPTLYRFAAKIATDAAAAAAAATLKHLHSIFNGFSFTTPSGYINHTAGHSRWPERYSQWTARSDSRSALTPIRRVFVYSHFRHVLGRPIANRKRDNTAIVVGVSSLYWPAQAWLDGNRHQHQMAPATFCPRTRELAACEPRALPRPVPGKPISLWTLIWICAAPLSSLRVGRDSIGSAIIYAIINAPSELMIVKSMAL
ncbi:hypothetical protein FAVG1_03795 [Fusarium avenaceum]|nr:hypothetical protein FAVG1_03795 [Fusarium avenaceum]